MSSAGQSAARHATRVRAEAEEHTRLAAELTGEAERFTIASRTEQVVSNRLTPLTAIGYSILDDRGWPGHRSANIDHVVVGPGGLFILDTKAWAEVGIERGRIFRGQDDVTDDLSGLADVGYGAEAVMTDLGLAPGAVHVVIVLAGRTMEPEVVGSVTAVGERNVVAYIRSHGRRLPDDVVAAVTDAARVHFPELDAQPTPLDMTILQPVLPNTEPEPLFSVEEVLEMLVDDALSEPIESWMSFLHPSQAKLVRRSFSGPSRIRGAAGTGKTVVGLHRAAYLARSQPKRVLVTSVAKTLPPVFAELVRRLAPEIADRIDFVGVHAFAYRLAKERNIHFNLKPIEADLAFTEAWREVGLTGPLHTIDKNQQYWKDEISHVIKGRGISEFRDYADLVRTGRRRGLTQEQRKGVWQLYVAYDRRLRAQGIHDFDDVILLAEASLRARSLDTYGAVIIDEAQDLTCAMARMLHTLVGDAPDGLTVIGDGQQAIYPGGFTLAEAGIAVIGRSVVMSTNYRNTRQIVEFAAHAVEGDEFADIDGGVQTRDLSNVARSGPAPVLERFQNRNRHNQVMVDRLRHLDYDLGDVGILSLTKWGVEDVLRLLRAAGIPAINLDNYSGRPIDAIKVGTVKRAKGLEFKSVLMPRVRPEWIDASDRDDEARVIRSRELYVGMTRARDELWVGVCS